MSSTPLPTAIAARQRPSALAHAAWTAWNMAQLAFTLAWTCGLMPFAFALHLLTRDTRLPLRMASQVWAPGLLWGAGARLRVEGADGIDWTRPYMLVANHQSIIDICVLFRAVPVPLRFALKQEMTRVPLVGRYARTMGMVFLERGNSRSGMRMIQSVVAMLSAGQIVCVFPEGTRSRDGRVAEFKGGAFQAAIAAGVPVLPVAIHGAGAVLPVDGLFRVRPGRIVLRFGTPLPSEGSDRGALAAAAHRAIVRMLEEVPPASAQAAPSA